MLERKLSPIARLTLPLLACMMLSPNRLDAARPAPEAAAPRLAGQFGRLPMSFEPNLGQAAPEVRFLARGRGYSLFLNARAAVLAVPEGTSTQSGNGRLEENGIEPSGAHSFPLGHSAPATEARVHLVRMELEGARPDAPSTSMEPQPGVSSYFLGNDPSQWHSGIPNFARVGFRGVYPGIDLAYYGTSGRLEYDFTVAPGADPNRIRLAFPGAQGVRIGAGGSLEIPAGAGSLTLGRPVVYQMTNGRRRPIEASFRLLAAGCVGFALGRYDRSRPLIIDPTLAYSTFLGGTVAEYIVGAASDSSGNAYVTGLTISLDFPTTAGAFQSVNFASAGNAVSTAFIAKMNASGTALLYSTYLGGNAIANTAHQQGDYGHAIRVDAAGTAYVTGWTYSANFPVTAGAFQLGNRTAAYGRATGFVTRLNAAGTALVYSTYLGGSTLDEPEALALDASGNAYVAGITFSSDFPVTGSAYQKSNRSAPIGGYNDFVAKLNPSGTGLVYSTYLGGSNDSGGGLGSSFWTNPIAVDKAGNAYMAGFTESGDFPVTPGAVQPTNYAAFGGYEITVTKLNPTGSGLVYSTYLGGSSGSLSQGLGIDGAGNAYVAGFTSDRDFPVTKGAFQTTNRAASTAGNTGASTYNGFLTKINATGSALVYSTYLGGTAGPWGGDGVMSLGVDANGYAYAGGYATSADFPVTAGAFQTKNRGAWQCCVNPTYASNAFLTVLNPAGTGLYYSTFFGGSGVQNPNGPGAYGDSAYAVALGPSGRIFLAGAAASANFPVTRGSFETKFTSLQNTGFLSMWLMGTPPAGKASATALTSSLSPSAPGALVTFTAQVAPATATGAPTGSVVFSVDEKTAATVTLNAAGKASWSSSTLAAGAHYILASYAGSTAYQPSGSGFNQVVAPLRPVISPKPGTYFSQQTVTITSPTKAGVLYYTLDGSAPTRFSKPYTAPLVLNYNTLVNTVAVAANDANSTVVSGAFHVIHSPVVLAAPATAITATGATLNAYADPQGLAGNAVFRYGSSPSALNTSSAATTLSSAAGRTQVTTTLSGLKSKTTYYYLVGVSTAAGSTNGAVQSFTTP